MRQVRWLAVLSGLILVIAAAEVALAMPRYAMATALAAICLAILSFHER